MESAWSTIDVAGGRIVELLVAGPEGGLPLLLHSGTPGGLVPFGPSTKAASARGLRTVKFARPGYGRSTPRPGRSVADVADDVTAILDALGAVEFVTVGTSGGGPHALACASLLPTRCLAAASVAGGAPFRADGLDWMAGMAAENVEEFGAAVRGEAALTAFLEAEAQLEAGVTGPDIAEALGGLVSEADKAVLTGEFAEHMAASTQAALSGGIAGWRDDDLAFVRDWGFPLGPVRPVAIWHGGQDRFVPFAHGEWLARHVPGARPHLLPDEGHLTLTVTSFGRILDDLLDLAGLTR